MAGLVPAIHALPGRTTVKTWMPGTRPGMTEYDAALLRTRAGNFSVGPLMEFLNRLGQDVRITVRPTRKRVGEMEDGLPA
jgi:hypothetical protein